MNDSLGDRMKCYESVSRDYLMKRTPVIIRLDGKSFHTFTKGFDKPFDERLMKIMIETTKFLVRSIDGCYFGYTQSDEISLLLVDYKTLQTEAWLNNNIQKIVSISSSLSTAFFNQQFKIKFSGTLKSDNLAFFDSRAFNLPKEEVVNYFIWRQQDASRNSVQMIGRSYFSHKELINKSCDNIQEMLFSKFGVNYNNIETYKKRGTCIFYKDIYRIDKEIPIFTQDRNYIQHFVDIGE